MDNTHILVVEDQRAVAGALRMRLRGLGYDVLDVAIDGNEAVEKAITLRPDLILMDIRLGDGIDGIEAARRIRARFDIPVVYVTAYADNELLRSRACHAPSWLHQQAVYDKGSSDHDQPRDPPATRPRQFAEQRKRAPT